MKHNIQPSHEVISTKRRTVAVFLLITILSEIISPTCALALTGGPSQPEVQSFEPVGTSDMVDLFSGDFNYNIPLLDVDGYPINIAYQSGITMDQEASWVGLGWNINPGVINRGMRGVPDDFNGDEITKEFNMKPNKTYGVTAGVGVEVLGTGLGLSRSIGVRNNNYTGLSIEQSLNVSISAGIGGASQLTGGLGITSSSDDGLSLQPSVSFQSKISTADKKTTAGLGLSVGAAFNSRAGLKTLSINSSASVQAKGSVRNTTLLSGGAGAAFDFGMPAYTPQVTLPMQNLSITGNFKLGTAVTGVYPNYTLSGYYSVQKLAQNTISNPAYGYMHADEGTKYDNAILDFNREKDGTFSESTPSLPLTNFTYDIFSVSGQGIGGSYRPFRGDMGQVFDASSYTTSDGYSIGAEVGLGAIWHVGVDVALNDVYTQSGRWRNGNIAANRLVHRATTNDPLYESYYFKEANEKSVDADPTFFNNAGGYDAKSVNLVQQAKYNTIASGDYREGGAIPTDNYRKKRERRNQAITTISRGELSEFGVEVKPNLHNAPDHHIAEVTTLRSDGARYVYGIAAYNTRQDEVTFSVGKRKDNSGGHTGNANTGLVSYDSNDNSVSNDLGLDNYFSNTKMPAFAHSYLLTSVLSPDYVDSDNNKGPSAGDIGNYTKFNYTKINDYKWRVPVGEKLATHNEGLKSDLHDDKANYIYGEKELWYLTQIETKNYIAIFKLEPRKDGAGVTGTDGIVNTDTAKASKLLRKISLYSKHDYIAHGASAIPLKEVHFEYDYSLCSNLPNNVNYGTGAPAEQKGKLTLKKIFFTYQNSNKARLSPYQFTYSSTNPDYNIKGYDRWGNYKPNAPGGYDAITNTLPAAEYPYVEQNKTTADNYTQAWTLTNIQLPSGGKIQVDYESDDYAYVQNKNAMQMFKVVKIEENTGTSLPTPSSPTSISTQTLNYSTNGTRLVVKLQDPITGTNKNTVFKERYLGAINHLYFRFLIHIKSNYEYVSGYLTREQIDLDHCFVDATGDYACIALNNTTTNDNSGTSICPITKAGLQFGRLNLSKEVWSDGSSLNEDDAFGEELLTALMNSSFSKNISEALEGPNEALYKKFIARTAVSNKSWVRLNNPNKHKLGGGCRVKKIRTSDEWAGMTDNTDQTFKYGQEYTYTNEDGSSSGVASYEPQLGGDENPWKQPVYFEEKRLLAPDDEHYMEEPFGESFFPSPSVGYGRVTVKNLQYSNVTHHATGKVVHAFYTANDFPTITTRTAIDPIRHKPSKFSIQSLLNIDVKDHMTATQGYVIELNDMHGKPKSQAVYAEKQTTPISSVEYRYKSTPYQTGNYRLDNTAAAIYPNGNIDQQARLGVFFDMVADTREHKTTSNSTSINGNIDGILIFLFPVPIPIILPSVAYQETQFRSIVLTKVIQRFGLLEETIAKDLGSIVSTKNTAYDAETGEVLLTQTTTDFNDAIYSLTVPAHWHYNGMGPAYKNIGFTSNLSFTAGKAPVANALKYYVEGDELALSNGTASIKAWVTKVASGYIEASLRTGVSVPNDTYTTKVIRSGRKNQQTTPIASITSLSNPLTQLSSNIYDQVLQASATEFGNDWKTFCDCPDNEPQAYSTNPYVLGTKGFWKPKKAYLHLSDRTQSNYNNNSNIRKDGIMTSFTPFYKLTNGAWAIDDRNWTYTSEVTEFSPFGPILENKDALGRYSASTYGYNQSLATAQGVNTRYQEMGVTNFEDQAFSECADNHFKFTQSGLVIDQTQSHTGKRSLKVSSSTPVVMSKQLVLCDSSACNLQLVQTYNYTLSRYEIMVTSGTAPYTFNWTVNNGNLSITLAENGNGIYIKNPASGSVVTLVLNVKDGKDCRKAMTTVLTSVSTTGED